MNEYKVHIQGTAPLLMHNGQLADPLNVHTKAMKEITGKRKKTDDDFEAIARIEWFGGLYLTPQGKPGVPGEVIEGCIRDGAKQNKQGKTATADIMVEGVIPLVYEGPKDVDALFEDARFRDVRGVKIGQARTMRCRPRFDDWAMRFTVVSLGQMNPKDVEMAIRNAGVFVGLCDFRPKFGRFELVGFK